MNADDLMTVFHVEHHSEGNKYALRAYIVLYE